MSVPPTKGSMPRGEMLHGEEQKDERQDAETGREARAQW
jgi:hypothetical protein